MWKMLGGDGEVIFSSYGASKSFGLREHQLLPRPSSARNHVAVIAPKLCM